MLKRLLDSADKFIEHSRFSGIVIALLSFLVVFLISLTGIYETFELKAYDLRFEVKPSIDEWDRLAFVDIDENSITTIGEYPWPRHVYAKGLSTLKRVGAAFVTLDQMFLENSPMQVNREALNYYKQMADEGYQITGKDIELIAQDIDKIFSDGVADMGRVLLSYTFNPDPMTDEEKERQQNPEFMKARERFLELASIKIPESDLAYYKNLEESDVLSISYPIPELMNASHSFGFVNRDTDSDGAVRKVRLIRNYKGRLFFNLGLVMLIDICNVSKENIVVKPGKKIVLKQAQNPMTHRTEDIVIPIDNRGMMYVNWAGSGTREKTFKLYSYYALIEYPEHVDDANAFFEEIEKENDPVNGSKLTGLYQSLEMVKKEYASSGEPEVKQKKWKKITELRKSISETKIGYTSVITDEIKRVKKELEIKEDAELRDYVLKLENDIQRIKLVVYVESLADKLTLTGLTAAGTIDIGVTPLHKEYAMVGAYHNTVNTILNNAYIRKTGSIFNYVIMLIIAIVMGFSIQRLSARVSLITIGASFLAVNLFVIILFAFFYIWIEQLGVSLALLLPSFTIASIKFMKEESQKRFIKSAFSRYLTPGVIDEIIKNPDALELGGENRNITIFFSDVAKFSTISEKLTPPQLVNLLNEYLSEMTDIILSHGGTVDKYEGDAIMAFYGAPHSYEDHPLRACVAAIDMKKRLREMQEVWRKADRDELHVRMGMNTGEAVVGNMGSKTRMDYTAMGDSVNLASRLEGANKFYSTYALLSETTYEGAKEYIDARKLDRIRVVGKTESILLYELLGKKDSLPDKMYEMLDKYYTGFEYFTNHQWRRALAAFKEGLKIIPDDGPSLTYEKRCKEFIKKAPPKSWDGIFSFKTK